jgi:hypothetical protein
MISIIIPCKNRLNHLSETFVLTKRLQGEYEIIIVDYNCPMGTADYIQKTFPNEAKIIKAEVGDNEWSLSHARNLGYKGSIGDALLFIDADTKLKSDFLVKHPLNENEFYTGMWLHASGCCMIWRKDFEMVKGYNEVIQSWGTEDYDIYRRLEGRGLKRNYFNKKSFENIRHHDRLRNEYHGRKNIHISNEENYQKSIKEFRSCIE